MTGSFLAACAVLAVAIILLVGFPALRQARARDRSGFNLAVYRDQLTELERDRARGVIGGPEAAAARLEIERRILKTAERTEVAGGDPSYSGRIAVALVALVLPLLAGGLYWHLGAPQLSGATVAREGPGAEQPDIPAMVARLEARLAENPDDAQGWLMLGRSRSVLGDSQAAVQAYRKAHELRPDEPQAVAGLAESLIMAESGVVNAEARELLGRLEQLSAGDPRAGYYLGLAAAQAGDNEAAAARWSRLLADGAPDAPWRQSVIDAIRGAAADFGIDADKIGVAAAQEQAPASPGPSPGPATNPSEAARIAALPPAERQARINAMVDGLEARLEADGGGVAGWSRLAQARMTLGQRDKALLAFDRALALAPGDADLLKSKGRALLEPAEGPSGLPVVPAAAATLFEQAAAAQPKDAEAQWFLGIAALQAAKPDDARRHWEQALAALDPSQPEYAEMQARLKELPGATGSSP